MPKATFTASESSCLAEQLETLGSIAAGANMVAHVRDTGKADSGGPGVIAACFAAGMLRHLPALMAWTLPSAASYARIQPSCWSGAYRWAYSLMNHVVRRRSTSRRTLLP